MILNQTDTFQKEIDPQTKKLDDLAEKVDRLTTDYIFDDEEWELIDQAIENAKDLDVIDDENLMFLIEEAGDEHFNLAFFFKKGELIRQVINSAENLDALNDLESTVFNFNQIWREHYEAVKNYESTDLYIDVLIHNGKYVIDTSDVFYDFNFKKKGFIEQIIKDSKSLDTLNVLKDTVYDMYEEGQGPVSDIFDEEDIEDIDDDEWSVINIFIAKQKKLQEESRLNKIATENAKRLDTIPLEEYFLLRGIEVYKS